MRAGRGRPRRATSSCATIDFTALDDATFDVHFGEALGIVGPNGSGKSTLLKTIAGLLTPASGELVACSAR